jgi:ketosteroid isomerase-like protein
MRSLRCIAIFSMLALASCAAPQVYEGSPLEAEDHARMNAALKASADAWNAGDLRGHLAIYDESVTVMTKSGPRPTIAAIEASFSAAYFRDGKPKQKLRMESVAIRSLSRDSARMTGRFVLSGGGEAEQSGWFTLIWVRKAAGWKAVHDHTS